ncbi:MAG TPA: hypothetical protein H9861_01195 [Candidatus Ligilactobacillus excrementigallinarum]|uniref:Uncharacterized protein n=1 Tax=Candidatus Ligilactobacillus excrementigallinarum TaxID=2838641 RepID=A0A9D1UVS6_9LACO|nr:hypothetical protein [Candidatus Ligilactobacillus excrementigallinarum]
MNKQDKAKLFEMLTDLKDFEQQFKQVTDYDEENEIIKNLLSVMFYGQHYIDEMLEIVKNDLEK